MSGGLARLTLVLGGARSGKSAYAEGLLDGFSTKLYLATAEAHDEEMAERIRLHQTRRGDGWETVEAAVDTAGAIRAHADPERPILLDCLTLWLTHALLGERDVEAEVEELLAALRDAAGPVVVVSNEVGLGIVPDNELARRFRDLAGASNRRVAEIADRVVFVAAGLPLTMKDVTPQR